MIDFIAPSTNDEALATLADLGSDAVVIAGGTDVMVQYLRGEIDPNVLVYIGGLTELKHLGIGEGRVSIGALTTHRTLATDPEVRRLLPALAEAAATVGGWQTQAVGTVAGNICNASPAADLAAPLLVSDAIVDLAKVGSRRSLPLGEFLLGRRKTARSPDELVTGLHVEPCGDRTGEAYVKVGRRGAMEVAIVGVAVRLSFDGSGRVDDAAIAVCSASVTPYRAHDAEGVLVGSAVDESTVAEAAHLLKASASPISDTRAEAGYRLRILEPLLRRAVATAAERAAA